jgi:hypothetical protein
MDFVKNAMNKGQGQQAAQGTQGTAAGVPQAQGAQKEDYVDKGMYLLFLRIVS